MILSMTGFGKSQYLYDQKNYTLELKSLNSKSLDVNLRVPSAYRSREIEIRKLMGETVIRGKVDLSLHIENDEGNKSFSVNTAVVNSYVKELEDLKMQTDKGELLAIAMRLPEAISNDNDEISKEEWERFLEAYQLAFEEFSNFRSTEGKAIEEDFLFQINSIDNLLNQVDPFLEDRNNKLEEKLKQALDKVQVDFDEQRYHQEVMYYMEKWDVTEEKVRLKQHLEYFIQTLQNKDESKGKLLGFICQEIGREINTLGSKANQSDIQKIVVQMKDSLEKIKEQVYNVL